MSQYKLLNKELTLEVQKLRVHLREFEKNCNDLRYENKEIRAENSILRSYIAQNFQICSQFSQKFSTSYFELMNRGIQISLPEVSDTRQSISTHRRLSNRNSLPTTTHQNFTKSPVKKNVPDAVYPTSNYNNIRRRNMHVEPENSIEEFDDERAENAEVFSNNENVPELQEENELIEHGKQLGTIVEEASVVNEPSLSVMQKSLRKENTSRRVLKDITNDNNSVLSFERETTPENYLEGDISLDVRNNINAVACSTPVRRSSSEPKIVIEKVRLSAEEVSEYVSNFHNETSTTNESRKRSKKDSSDRSVARRSSGRPKRTVRPREGSMVEKPLNRKLRRTE